MIWLENCNFYTLKCGSRTGRAFGKSYCPEKPYKEKWNKKRKYKLYGKD